MMESVRKKARLTRNTRFGLHTPECFRNRLSCAYKVISMSGWFFITMTKVSFYQELIVLRRFF